MNAKERFRWAEEIEAHLFGHILPYWTGPAVDRRGGGFHGWLSNEGKPDPTQPRGLVLYSRLLWTFSAAHELRPDAEYHSLADRAGGWLLSRFWDSQYKGGFWHVDASGRVTNDSKQIYGQAFGVYAWVQYHLAFGSSDALDRARQWYESVDQHAHDARFGGYGEAYARDWSTPAVSLVGGQEFGAVKSMNTHLHLLEAWSLLYRAWPDPGLSRRLRELLALFWEKVLDPTGAMLHHYFSADWRVLSSTYTYGHNIEAAWLFCEAADALGDPFWQDRARSLAIRMSDVVLEEAVGSDGGVAYEGRAGRVIAAFRDWWVQAEALVGFLNAWQISGKERYTRAARRVWQFIRDRVADPVHGDWFWRVEPDGQPDRSRPKVSEWKCPYHSSRACLEAIRRLRAGPLS
ncbi:MAG: AGE family epimerase/isomerase [Verrucomicrobiota bacterium]|nr:AGE family epimerase/isomerase [Limisphaera sp.]MDW8380974.1 AGE family epimerase/isomerase [Verrucomicrobiota bacterium]